MADDRSNPEILPPPKWLIPRPTATQRKWIVAGSASALVGFILWAFNEFTSLRGVFHVLMSRFILAGMWVAGVLLLVLLVSVLQLPYKRTIVLIVSLIWAAGLLGLDWLAPKQQTVTIAQPCSSITVTPRDSLNK